MSRFQIVFSVSLTVFLFLLLVTIFFLSRTATIDKTPPLSSQLSPVVSPIKTPVGINDTRISRPIAPPKIAFAHWKTTAPQPQSKSPVNIYALRTVFSDQYIRLLSKALGIVGPVEIKNNSIFTSNESSFLLFNTTSGSFTYYSHTGMALSQEGAIDQKIYAFLQSLGVYDQSMRLTAQYKKQKQPDITYYEIHRDWDLIGLPILNSFGLSTLPENIKLSELSLTKKLPTDPVDPTIYATSDGRDGYKRNTDFNTITIAVDKNNKVVSISSHMRLADTTQTQQTNIKDYTAALQEVESGKADSVITAPAGEGAVQWDKVYPGNIAAADEAVITDSLLSYLEDPLIKTSGALEPWYIFKGFTQSKSGYRLQFIATVKATQKSTTHNIWWQNIFAPVFAFDNNQVGSQHQGTFTLSSPSPSSVKNTQPVPPKSPAVCEPTAEQIRPLQDWNGIQIGFYGWYYMVNSGLTTETQLQDWINSALERHEDGNFNREQGGMRELIDIIRDLATTPECPVRLTGPSPSLFIYGNAETPYTIKPLFNLTYSDPGIMNSFVWNIRDNTVNGVTRDYLYYEYQPVTFSKPLVGWYISKKDIEDFANTLSRIFALKPAERTRLSFELHHSLIDVAGEKIYIGLLDPQTIQQKLPLQITPSIPTVYRYHFYISPKPPTTFTSPKLEAIKREKEMIIEFGAVVGE